MGGQSCACWPLTANAVFSPPEPSIAMLPASMALDEVVVAGVGHSLGAVADRDAGGVTVASLCSGEPGGTPVMVPRPAATADSATPDTSNPLPAAHTQPKPTRPHWRPGYPPSDRYLFST